MTSRGSRSMKMALARGMAFMISGATTVPLGSLTTRPPKPAAGPPWRAITSMKKTLSEAVQCSSWGSDIQKVGSSKRLGLVVPQQVG